MRSPKPSKTRLRMRLGLVPCCSPQGEERNGLQMGRPAPGDHGHFDAPTYWATPIFCKGERFLARVVKRKTTFATGFDLPLPARQSRGLLLLLLGLAVIATATIGAIFAENRKRDAAMSVRHTISVERSLTQLAATLGRIQSGERGFLLTQDETYLEPVDAAARQVATQIDRLRDLVSDDPTQLQRIDTLVRLINDRLQLSESRTQAVREGRIAEALTSFKGGRGKELMDHASNILDSLLKEADGLYQQHEQTYFAASEWLRIMFGFLFLAVAAVGLLILLSSERQLHAVEGVNEKLREANEKLHFAYEEVVQQVRQRIQIEAQLRQSQKLEALGHLAGGIAHDFNNLLSVILASLHIMRRRLESGSTEVGTFVDSAEESVNKAARLVRRLLAFSREQPLDPKVLDLNERIDGMLEILRRTLGSRIELERFLLKEAHNLRRRRSWRTLLA
jgi:CHASE3 domain sensor protein